MNMLMTQNEFRQLLLYTYTKVKTSEELALQDLINEIRQQIEQTCDFCEE